ncbi:hypothetical protein GDO86_020245 [Hymenochirus boettgeri]|uniref:Grh/CP2 DB domain-containing protein n=1 Tax=Hymenochirus boettgeri TaxID=247094 RepID=A0A8T2IFL4_9PIPI|nr:hypothetical protein GDO86_020245 [Hymenochirus boettgeri]
MVLKQLMKPGRSRVLTTGVPQDTILGEQRQASPFQYVLCAATSPAVKLHEETLTYLNQVFMKSDLDNRKLGEFQDLQSPICQSIIRVVFQIRLQYMEHQQLEGWKWSRPGDRILDIGQHPLSVGILDPRSSPTQLNTVEFLWDPSKRSASFIQVHCISTEFTPRKHGGEKGVPFRIQIDTLNRTNGEYTEICIRQLPEIKVFKCSPWPELPYQANSSSSPGYNSSPNTFSIGDGNSSPTEQKSVVGFHSDIWNPEEKRKVSPSQYAKVQQWLERNRFPQYCRVFSNFSGNHPLLPELARIVKNVQGRFCQSLSFTAHRNVRPRLNLYVCHEPETKRSLLQHKRDQGDSQLYHAIFLDELTSLELIEKIANLYTISPSRSTRSIGRDHGIHVVISSEMVQNFQDESAL